MSIYLFIILVIMGAILTQVIGMFWYSKLAFKKLWMKSIGKDDMLLQMERKNGMVKVYLGSFLASLVSSFFILSYATSTPYLEWWEAMYRGACFVVLFVAPLSISAYLFERRSLISFVIVQSFILVVVSLQMVLFTQIIV